MHCRLPFHNTQPTNCTILYLRYIYIY
jgi:hypothetical protein